MTQPLEHILIVGGGTSGWMTAAALSKYVPASTKITLIESDEIGIIGVGEASIPPLIAFNKLLGIDEREFIRNTRATFKLGIEFVDWHHKGDRYLHPFGKYGRPLDLCEFHHYWLKAHLAGKGGRLQDYSLNTLLSEHDRFNPGSNDQASPLSTLGYAYHFDAALYAGNLRNFAVARGVNRIEGKIISVEQHPESGFVQGVTLNDGQRIEADFFVDCSGFRGLLIEGALKTGYVDWSALLPCDRAVAVPTARVEPLTPYTRATAREAGWQWRIPLQHRTGNGHVYASGFIDDDAAVDTLLANLDAPALADPRLIRFHTGRRRLAWNKNCVAIGLSAGFLEPLESTSIHLIQKGVTKLLACLPDKSMSAPLRDEFNRQTQFDYEDVRDFIVLHYKATMRDDTPFWDYCRNSKISDSLAARMELFRDSGRVFVSELELFKLASWVAVFMGQGVIPRSYDPMADKLDLPAIEKSMGFIAAAFQQSLQASPSHADFIRQNCAAEID
jgi:tryptophan 7-halogenase